ncbi:MAG: Tripartite tricarboxylate transporter family receptor, partial [Clostridiales bacterium]|nr:Tripartite tricarboxylate transporter family receptor [Clostridiales bacterium]
TTLLGGNTLIGGGAPADMPSMLQSKRVRPIAVVAKERDKVLPDVPTLIEQGVKFSSWGIIKGISAPPQT